ncbi:MAG: hypothetical protein ACXVCF_16730, partial [Isosphaeraceae bacterium]
MSLIDVLMGIRANFALTFTLLVGYWMAMTLIAVPGRTAGDLSREGNLAAMVDRAVLGRHLYKPDYDPEGLLST